MAATPAFALAAPAENSESCSRIDLRPSLGEPRDQRESGWCFAHVAADLLTQKIGERVSASDLALQSALMPEKEIRSLPQDEAGRYLNDPDLQRRWRVAREPELKRFRSKMIMSTNGVLNVGGNEDFSLALASVKGACLERDLPDEDLNSRHGLRAVEDLRDLHDKTACASSSRDERACGRVLRPASPSEDLSPLIDRMSEGMSPQILKWADRQCGQRRRVHSVPRILQVADDAEHLDAAYKNGELEISEVRARILERLNEALEAGRVAAIGYSANDVLTRDSSDRWGDHASVIAGRRPGAKGCEYFVRQSWGQGCDGYRRRLNKVCEPETGGMWLRLEQLPSIYSVTDLPN